MEETEGWEGLEEDWRGFEETVVVFWEVIDLVLCEEGVEMLLVVGKIDNLLLLDWGVEGTVLLEVEGFEEEVRFILDFVVFDVFGVSKLSLIELLYLEVISWSFELPFDVGDEFLLLVVYLFNLSDFIFWKYKQKKLFWKNKESFESNFFFIF